MPQDSPNWRMANRLADGRLDEIVTTRIARGDALERISRDLLTEYGIDVSRVSLRNWYGTEQAAS